MLDRKLKRILKKLIYFSLVYIIVVLLFKRYSESNAILREIHRLLIHNQHILGIILTIWLFSVLFGIRLQWIFKKLIQLLASVIKKGIRAIQRLYKHIRKKNLYLGDMTDIDGMTGIEFEEYLEVLFLKKGYLVKTTATTGDYGADLILSRRMEVTVVQAKRYNGSIGVKAVQEVIGAKGFYKAQKGMVVTNSYFTPNAVTLAKANYIELWDRDKLSKEITKVNRRDECAGVSD